LGPVVPDLAIEEATQPTPSAQPAAQVGRAAGGPVEPHAAVLAVLERASGAPAGASWAVRLVAFTLAVAAHAGLLYMLAREPEDAMAGGQGRVLDASSVTVVASTVLESLDPNRTLPVAPAAAAAVEANEGASEAAAAEKQRARKTEEAKTRHEEEHAEQKPPPEPARAEAVIEAASARKQPPAEPEAAGKAKGGAVALGDAAAGVRPSGVAAASPGAVREYGNHVRQALGRTRPRKGVAGLHASVMVEFVISGRGTLASARVAKSSGYERLDDLALEAVQRAAFPAPPADMTALQLTYRMTYSFR
jgi:TonB family protein